MRSYSVDLRERVADAVLVDGLTWPTVAGLFRLSVARVGRFVHARRTGDPGVWTTPKIWKRCGPNWRPNPT